jgi:hypothetical protein
MSPLERVKAKYQPMRSIDEICGFERIPFDWSIDLSRRSHPISRGEAGMNKTIEYRTIDKSAWQPGVWQDEPDKAQWYDDGTGFPCLIVRGPHGALCGYVGVRPGHPWHGMNYDSIETADKDEYGFSGPFVHGGLTFSGPCSHGDDPSRGICHVPAPGDTDNVWWLGFDCAHAGDYTDMKYDDGWRERFPADDDVYRDFAYVRAEIESLARQAASATGDPTYG